MTEIHTVHAISKNFLNIHFNIILPFMAISELANLCHACSQWHSERILGTRHSLLSHALYLLSNQRLCVVMNMYIYVHTYMIA